MTRFRRRTVEADGQAFTVVWDGRKGAPSLLPDDYPAIDGNQDPSVEGLRRELVRRNVEALND